MPGSATAGQPTWPQACSGWNSMAQLRNSRASHRPGCRPRRDPAYHSETGRLPIPQSWTFCAQHAVYPTRHTDHPESAGKVWDDPRSAT